VDRTVAGTVVSSVMLVRCVGWMKLLYVAFCYCFDVNMIFFTKYFSKNLYACKTIITFCVSRRRRKMYCGYSRLCVCLSAAVRPHYCTDSDVTWGMVEAAP